MPKKYQRRQIIQSLILSPAALATGSLSLSSLVFDKAVFAHTTAMQSEFISHLERDANAIIGFAAKNLATGQVLVHRGMQRFAMCSTFKWLLAALILKKTESGEESLNRAVNYTADDIVSYSPVTETRLPDGRMTVSELCLAAVSRSDNTASNLLLDILGGPSGFNQQLRQLGDSVTRLDRIEPELNENTPGDPRDTSTPLAMLDLMEQLLFRDTLTQSSKNLLQEWMIASNTGLSRLRGGIPEGWKSGDKTGTSINPANTLQATNDVAFAIASENIAPTGPVVMASYVQHPQPMSDAANLLHQRLADNFFHILFQS